MQFRTVILTLCLFLAATLSAGDNWPQWRGPHLDQTSSEENLPLEWGPESNVAWKLAMPARSGATPIVWGDRIFLSVGYDPQESDRLELWCVDRRSGQPVWKRELGGGNEILRKQNLSSPSPVTDGKHVYVVSGTGILRAYDFEGQQVWTRDLQADYGAFGLKWGYASSPLLHEDALYLQVLHGWYTDDPSYLLRIDKATGKTLWKVERPEEAYGQESPDSYATPALLRHNGHTQIVIVGADVVTGHDPEDGKELWRVGGLNPEPSATQRLVASPVVGNGYLYVFGKRGPILAYKIGDDGTISSDDLAWTRERGTDVPTPVTDGRYLYVVNDRGVVTTLRADSGQVVYGPERVEVGTYSASPLLADGRIYATSEEGTTTVFKTGPQFEVLATNKVQGYTLSTPAISNGQFFIRTAEFLYAVGSEEPEQ
ncbi:MAG TPA: PQQ-binding-like beta-propeller repeat protein [Acidobacteriota bacterium]|nr:PQQ-binding-like beta-propeller repeat protein [Acidobacteriota bacterium]